MHVLPSPLTSGSTANIRIFRNGTQLSLAADAGGYNSNLGGIYARGYYNLYLGTRYDWRTTLNNYYIGTIGEMIIYSRNLKDSERKAVEEYLSKKWEIKLQ
jgi:hypothetical protein